MSDKLIKASNAVDIVAKHSALYGDGEVSTDEGEAPLYDIMSEIMNLPSAEPERKMGKWVKKSKTTGWRYECSECGRRPPKAEWVSGRYLSRYCPHCGARMENDL